MILDKIINATYDKYFEESNTDFCDLKKMKDYFIFDNSLICKLFEELKAIINNDDRAFWDEDYITLRILDAMKNSLKDKFPVKVFKNERAYETKFGDIAFVVTFHLPEGKTFNGVSFIEAKKDYPQQDYKFSAFESKQMNRFLENTRSSFYVFYSHKSFLPIIETAFLKQIIEGAEIKDGQLKIEHINIRRLLSTFPTQIDRYLKGYDLDFSKEALDISKGKTNKVGSPEFIFYTEVGFDGGAPEPTPGQTPPFNPNPDIYRKLDVKDFEEFLKNEKEEKEEQHNSGIKPRRNRGPGFF